MQPQSGAKPYKIKDPKQQQLYEQLAQHVGQAPSDFFLDVCRLMDGSGVELRSHTHVVAHLLREIDAMVRQVLATALGVEIEDKDGKEKHRELCIGILEALGVSADDNPAAAAWLDFIDDDDLKLPKRAHHRKLHAVRPSKETERIWRHYLVVLEFLIDALVSNYSGSLGRVEEVALSGQPTRKGLNILQQHVPNNWIALKYFFERLVNPELWLPFLVQHRFFEDPPEVVAWPKAEYLTSLAESYPELVCSAFLAIPNTDNMWVHVQALKAALKMPLQFGKQIALHEAKWIKSQGHLLHIVPNHLGELAVKMVGDKESSLAVVDSLVSWYVHVDDPHGEAWDLNQLIEESLSTISEKYPLEMLGIYCDGLQEAFTIDKKDERGKRSSQVWRPSIERHEPSRGARLENVLVTAILRTAQTAIEASPDKATEVVSLVSAHDRGVFRRLAMILASKQPKGLPEEIAQLLVNRGNFDDWELHYEYRILLARSFDLLSPKDQNKILSWIQGDPDMESKRKNHKHWTGMELSPEEEERFIGKRLLDWYGLIKNNLPQDLKGEYESLVQQYGEPEKPQPSFRMTSWSGPTSPKSVAELSTMPINDLVSFLNGWKPPGEWHDPTPEGLGRELQTVIKDNPEHFSTNLGQFVGVDPTYTRSIVYGLNDAVKEGKAIDWSSALSYFQWVFQQQRDPEEMDKPNLDRDGTWGPSRKAIINLLEEGMKAQGAAGLPLTLRKEVWSIIEAASTDPDPTPKHEAEVHDDYDPATFSINAVRSEALHAAIHYASWFIHGSGVAKSEDHGLTNMPEVQTLLDRHLDKDIEPSVAVHAVYGWHLPFLFWLDPDWVRSRLPLIFPTDLAETQFREAAWDTYVSFCQRLPESQFKLLEGEYIWAASRPPAGADASDSIEQSERAFAEHVMVSYLHGRVELDSPIIQGFFSNARGVARGHALDFIGRSLARKEKGDEYNAAELDRLRQLWEWRFKVAIESEDKQAYQEELSAFGWWFASGRFDAEWALTSLGNVVGIVGEVDGDHQVMECFVELSESPSAQQLEVLKALIEGARERWLMFGWRDELKQILQNMRQNGNEDVQRELKIVVSRLAAKGYTDYLTILNNELEEAAA